MKLTTGDIVYLYDTIGQISEKEIIEQAPADVKFLLVRNARALESVYVDFMQTRESIMLGNSKPAEDGSENRIASSEELKHINSEIAKIERIEVDVAVVPIPLAKLEYLNLDMKEINGLYPIIANEEA